MRHPRFFTPLIGVGLLGAFALGLAFPEVLAGAQRRQLAQGGLPESQVQMRIPDGGQGDLEPLHTYYQVLSALKDRFYGPLPVDAPLTYSAIRGLLRPLDDPYTRFLDPAS